MKNIIDKKYGRLTIVEEEKDEYGNIYYICKCDCGNTKTIRKSSIIGGKTKSCGCLGREDRVRRGRENKTHGLTKTRFYHIWRNMKGRCYNSKHNEYKNYGAKGIIVCDEWHTFENFMNDMYEDYVAFEEINGKDSATIDRISPSENYCKENCRWQTQQQQARNRSNNISVVVDGIEYITLAELAEAHDLKYQTVAQRYRIGKRDSDLIKPTRHDGNRKTQGGIQVEVDGVTYGSLTELQKAYPYISLVSISKRYKKGKRGLDLIQKP